MSQCPFVHPSSTDPAIAQTNQHIQILWDLLHNPNFLQQQINKPSNKPSNPPFKLPTYPADGFAYDLVVQNKVLSWRRRVVLARITAHSTINDTCWSPYTVVPLIPIRGVTNLPAYAMFEYREGLTTIMQGTPGSLGVSVDNTGKVSDSDCFVQPLGAGAVVAIAYHDSAKKWYIVGAANSAQ